MNKIPVTVVALGSLLTSAGCSVVPGPAEVVQRVSYLVQYMAEEDVAAMQERQRDVEGLRKEIQLEQETRRTLAEDRRETLEKQFEQSVRTELGLDLDYHVEVGKPELDVESLRNSLAEYENQLREYNEVVALVRMHNEEVRKNQTASVRYAISQGRGAEAVKQVSWNGKGASCEAPRPLDPTCALPSEGQRKESQIKEPTAPRLENLKMRFPVSISLSGNGRVEDASTRRSKKEAEGQKKEKCNPRPASCDAPKSPSCKAPAPPAECDISSAAHFAPHAETVPDFDSNDEPTIPLRLKPVTAINRALDVIDGKIQ